MAAPRKLGDRMFIATESFSCDVDGSPVAVIRGQTRVREGHPLLEGREMFFAEIEPHFEAGAPARSGETRG